MTTIEPLPNGAWQLNVLTENGWIRHIFQSKEELEKYAIKCYPPVMG